jgi:hypothetical protein
MSCVCGHPAHHGRICHQLDHQLGHLAILCPCLHYRRAWLPAFAWAWLFALLLAALLVAMAGCDLAPLDGGATFDSGVDAGTSEAASPAGPCISGYVEVHFTPQAWVYCQPVSVDAQSGMPCTNGQPPVWWGQGGMVRCAGLEDDAGVAW